jgi:hypothetical protein
VLNTDLNETGVHRRYFVSWEKDDQLIEKWGKSKADVLLISSEMFVIKLAELKKVFPDVTFISYISSPWIPWNLHISST